jgi:hypothetical protein
VSANRAVQRAAKNEVSLTNGPVLPGRDQSDLSRQEQSVRKMWLSFKVHRVFEVVGGFVCMMR